MSKKIKTHEWIVRNEYTRSAINYIAANVLLSEVLLTPEDFLLIFSVKHKIQMSY